ncbi:MAG: cation-translocating P-type ATPase, partial [Clostridia bacterium]|nr:cation-translocating P-type ATPase [Clostridia bacterium]
QWEEMTREEVLQKLQVNSQKGLSESEARRRLELVGPNQLKQQKRKSVWALFLAQFSDFMVIILLAAALISALLTEYADAVTILVIVIINAVLGFGQEYRAEKSLEKIKKLTAQETTVRREGMPKIISAVQLVPGDIVLLKTGDIIPADLRLLVGQQLEINEAVLTGESLPVKKRAAEVCEMKTALGDRKNMAYMGTVITRGKGLGVVVSIGMTTEMGQIAGSIQEIEEEATPLQKRLAQLGYWLVLCCLIIVGAVVFLGLARGETVYRMVLTGVSLAVAAIPEGLPAIVTVVLALGVQKMVKRQAIVRSLPAVETLGCATVICSDKTGTLTQNEMTVRQYYLSGEVISFQGEGYVPHGQINFLMQKKEEYQQKNKLGLELSFKIAALCNNAYLKKKETLLPGLLRKRSNQWRIMGDPTEGALLVSAAKAGFWREHLEKGEIRIGEIPFEAERKRMSVVYQAVKGSYKIYTKGAPDVLLNLCSKVWWEGKVSVLTPEIKAKILSANEEMASQALRVIGFAYRRLPIEFFKEKKNLFTEISLQQEQELEKDLVFVALAGMIDPPRQSAKQAIGLCKRAGIKTVMITGDHKKTAEAIAQELQIITNSGQLVLSGNDLDELTNAQLKRIINQVVVYARVSPRHKLRIVKMLKEAGHVVAMTGDGVNDAPAVKEADIGISMGLSGTDVTREAASLILANDDFATIVAAVEEGRIIYDNIRKFIRYLLSCNMGEVLTMFVAALLGLPLPMLPIQILWVNLVTDGLPAMALGLDPGDPGIMQRKPRSPRESIFAYGLPKQILVMGVLISVSTLLAFITAFYWGGEDLVLARTMAFTTLVVVQLFYVFPCRSESYSVFELGLFSNLFLVGAVLCSFGMQLIVLYVPFFQRIFKTMPLQLSHWGLVFCFAIGITLLQRLVCTVKIKRKRRIIYLHT